MLSSLSSDEEGEWEEWEPSEEEGSSSSGDESSEDGGGQAARARKRKATAKAQGGTVKRRSSFRGVTFHDGRWVARIKVNGQIERLGRFDLEEAAARAFDERAKQTHGSPVLNFLPDGSLNPDRKKRVHAGTLSGRPALPDPGQPSTYRGVRFNKGRWMAAISVNGQTEHLGRFDSEEAAARAYDERADELHNSPVLNFLPDGALNPDRKIKSRRRALPDPGRPSTYRGVRFNKGRWMAQISVNGRPKHLGRFDSEEAAARAYDERAKQTRDAPVLNFLPDGLLNPDRKKRGRIPAGQRAASAAAAEEDERTVAMTERAEQGTRSGSSRRRGRGVMVKKEEEEDERTVSINEEADGEEARPGKRGRRHGNALKEEEEDARTVEIKGEDDEITLGVC